MISKDTHRDPNIPSKSIQKPNQISNKILYPELFEELESKIIIKENFEMNFISLDKFESVAATIYQANVLYTITKDVSMKFEKDDPYCKEKTTAEAIWNLLEKYIKLIFVISQSNQDEHCELFHVIYNTSQKVYRLVKLLKQFWRSSKLQETLFMALKSIESCPILMRPKYLEWKLKLHLGELIRSSQAIRRKQRFCQINHLP